MTILFATARSARVRRRVGRGRGDERVAILIPMGHRVAYDLGLVNVSPYASLESMPAQRQLQETIDALRESGGTRLFAARYQTLPDVDAAIRAAGFEMVRGDERHAEYRDETR